MRDAFRFDKGLKGSRVAVVGLGYVGLPLAIEFGRIYKTIGFDVNSNRVECLKNAIDKTREVGSDEIKSSVNLSFTFSEEDLRCCDVYVVAVPTPIDSQKQPDLSSLISASELIGRVVDQGDVVIYESTVYPGATEEDCVPIIEKVSGLEFNKGFYVGYSPERISPGDKERSLRQIKKITSGSTPEVAKFVDELYGSIITAGTFSAKSIKIAEAAKVVENTQRDVNIALVNEMFMIFDHLDINVLDVIEAASSKWNFVRYTPGLVGGHCIGVDPYYLLHKSMSVGYIPDIIRKAREINNGMAKFLVEKVVKSMVKADIKIKGARALVLGFSFKEECSDIRNTKVVDFVKELSEYGVEVDVFDPLVCSEDAFCEYGIEMVRGIKENYYDLVSVMVLHDEIKKIKAQVEACGKAGAVYFDFKSML